MAALRSITPSTTMPELLQRLLPIADADPFDAEDCDDSGSQDHILDSAADAVCVLRQEVA